MSFSAKPTYIPTFATTDYTDPGGRVNITEPTTDEKEKGWQYLQKPGSNKMNWIHRGNYYWINYFNQFWNSSHQFLINEIDSEGGTGISVLDTIKVDVINEYTASAGVTIEGITLLDGYINEPLGIKVAPVAGTNLHVHQADSATSISRFTNSTTTSAASHGTEFGLDASEQGRIWNYENTDIVIGTNNIERMRILNSGYVGIGTSTPAVHLNILQNGGGAFLQLDSYRSDSASGGGIAFYRSRGTVSSPTIVQNADIILYESAKAWDGANWGSIGSLSLYIDGVPGANDTPGRFVITTTNDGTNSSTEKFRITNAGYIGIANGGIDPLNPFHLQFTTTPQFRVSYDVSNYFTLACSSVGALTIATVNNIYLNPTSGYVTFMSGAHVYARDAGNTKAIQMYHDGTNGLLGTDGGSSGNIVITNTTECTGADTGALQVDGGMHVAKNLSVSGDLTDGAGVPVAGWLSDGTPYYKKRIAIGDWNMDTTLSKDIAHGIASLTYDKILSLFAIIRNDSGVITNLSLIDPSDGLGDGCVSNMDATNVTVARTTGGSFDNTSYDSTSYNRGYITIEWIA
jgi:hypothetical protein